MPEPNTRSPVCGGWSTTAPRSTPTSIAGSSRIRSTAGLGGPERDAVLCVQMAGIAELEDPGAAATGDARRAEVGLTRGLELLEPLERLGGRREHRAEQMGADARRAEDVRQQHALGELELLLVGERPLPLDIHLPSRRRQARNPLGRFVDQLLDPHRLRAARCERVVELDGVPAQIALAGTGERLEDRRGGQLLVVGPLGSRRQPGAQRLAAGEELADLAAGGTDRALGHRRRGDPGVGVGHRQSGLLEDVEFDLLGGDGRGHYRKVGFGSMAGLMAGKAGLVTGCGERHRPRVRTALCAGGRVGDRRRSGVGAPGRGADGRADRRGRRARPSSSRPTCPARPTTRRWWRAWSSASAASTSPTTTLGSAFTSLLHETSEDDFDRVIAVNLRGTFLGMKHQITQMLRNEMPTRGAIVNTSSNAGLRGGDAAERLHGQQARDPRT